MKLCTYDEKRFADTLRTGLGGWERWGVDAFDEEGGTGPSPSLAGARSLASSAPTVVYRVNCSPPRAPNYRGPVRSAVWLLTTSNDMGNMMFGIKRGGYVNLYDGRRCLSLPSTGNTKRPLSSCTPSIPPPPKKKICCTAPQG